MRNPGVQPAQLRELLKYRVNIPDAIEVLWEPLYDYQTYPAAGQTTFTFFQNQIGVGGRTLSDTNIESSGQIPKGKSFLVTGLEINFLQAASDLQSETSVDFDFLQNYLTVMTERAHCVLRIGSKEYLRFAPLIKAPPAQRLLVDAAADSTANGTGLTYAVACGKPLDLVDMRLESNQNFDVRVQFENPLPINQDGRLGVTLRGYLFRNAQ